MLQCVCLEAWAVPVIRPTSLTPNMSRNCTNTSSHTGRRDVSAYSTSTERTRKRRTEYSYVISPRGTSGWRES